MRPDKHLRGAPVKPAHWPCSVVDAAPCLIRGGAVYFLRTGQLHMAPLDREAKDRYYSDEVSAVYATDLLPQLEIDVITALLKNQQPG